MDITDMLMHSLFIHIIPFNKDNLDNLSDMEERSAREREVKGEGNKNISPVSSGSPLLHLSSIKEFRM